MTLYGLFLVCSLCYSLISKLCCHVVHAWCLKTDGLIAFGVQTSAATEVLLEVRSILAHILNMVGLWIAGKKENTG